MPHVADQAYLLSQQYNDGSRLAARGDLHARFSTNRTGWFPWLFDRFQLPAHSRILELGCGPGWLWLRNIARIPATWEVTLSDFSQGMVTEAQEQLQGAPHTFAFAVIDAQAIPFPPATFDAVIANHMLYHVPDRATALAEIRRVLRPGGRFFASTVGPQHLRQMSSFFPNHEDDFGTEYCFDLENGREQLRACFAHVDRYRYEDALVVTESEPLVAYLLSTRVAASLDDETRAELLRRVEHRMKETGSVQITKDVGLFIAS